MRSGIVWRSRILSIPFEVIKVVKNLFLGVIFIWWLITTVLYYRRATKKGKIGDVFVYCLIAVILILIGLFHIDKELLKTIVAFADEYKILLLLTLFVVLVFMFSIEEEGGSIVGAAVLVGTFFSFLIWLAITLLSLGGIKSYGLGLLVFVFSFSFSYTIEEFIPKDIPKIFDWFLVEFFTIVSKNRRSEIKALKEAKKQEKEESKEIQRALKKKTKEAKKLERKNIPKLPAKLDNEQIKKDIGYLQTLSDKGHLIKYIGGIKKRFIAKGQVKTYKEIDKVIRAKTEVENALEELAFAQEGRYTAQERAQAKYLLETLQAQDAIRTHYDDVKQDQSLRDLKLETEREKLEADKEEARKRKEIARKEIEDLHAPQPQQQQPKTRMDKLDEHDKERRIIKNAIARKKERGIADIKEQAKAEGRTAEESELDIEATFWFKKEMEELEKLERKYK